MKLTEVTYGTQPPVDGYGSGVFRVAGTLHQGAIVIGPGGADAWTGYDDIAPLTALGPDVDLLILGTGAEIARPPQAFAEAIERAGLALELMGSPAACRTYNVLLAENRRVALAVLPV